MKNYKPRYKLEIFYDFMVTKFCFSLDEALEEANFILNHGNKKIKEINIVEKRGRIKNVLSIKSRGGKEEIIEEQKL